MNRPPSGRPQVHLVFRSSRMAGRCRNCLLVLASLLAITAPAGAGPRPGGPYVPPPSLLWPRIAVICIDNASIQRIGRYPFDRALHARLVDRLVAAGARTIAFDLWFGEAHSADGDQALARAIARSHRTWLIVDPTSAQHVMPKPPLPLLARAAGWRLGVPQLEQGQHFIGGVRLAPYGTARTPNLLVGLMADTLHLHKWPSPAGDGGYRMGDWVLPTSGGVFTSDATDTQRLAINKDSRIRHYSYARVLDGQVAMEAFDGAIVLVGRTPSPRTGEELIFEDWSVPAWVMKSHVEALAIMLEKMFRYLSVPRSNR